jgi:tetratricopeptide (TPR) repeat protein
MGTLNISFHIALGQFRQAEHEMDLATASMMQGQYDEALIHYSLAIDKNHRKRQAWIGKGLALMYLKRYEESLENYEDLIRMDPNNVEAWQGKGMSLGFMGKYDEAIASYDRALEIQPDYNLIQTQRERLQELQKQ